ncbi:MAG: HEAT repeat domain-containing protein, partial [Candidatus Pacebacteria bacterium]|nr:HEAT repeat domain-containing protein [Candidatus Paceibacterota bacterium]
LVLGNATGPRVREAVLRAVSDPDTNVREASLLAMGRIAHPSFAPTLLTVLRSTSAGSDYSSKHRNIACWASGKLPSMPEDLAERLVRQATTPVIPVMGMMMFEPDYVLVSACWALAEGTRRDAALTPFAEKVITMQSRDTTNSAGMGSPNELSPSAEVREYARQAQAYMDGKPVQAHRRPTRDVHLIYSKID